MIWQTPLAFWLLLAVPAVAAMFLYRRRFPIIQVPSLGAWSLIGTPVKTSNWRSLLRRLLVFLLQVLLIGAIVVAAAGPRRTAAPQSSLIVVLDMSASMLSRTGTGSSRFDLAKREARQFLIQHVGSASLILAADIPALARTDGRPLSDVVDQLEPYAVDGHLKDALGLAQSLTGGRANVQVVEISDFLSLNPDLLASQWKGNGPLRLVQVGNDDPDAGFVSAHLVTTESGHILVQGQIAAHGMAGKTLDINAMIGGKATGSGSIKLVDGISSFELGIEAPAMTREGQILELRINAKDALDANNRMLLRFTVAKRRIAVVSSSPSALTTLIAAADNVDVQQLTPEQMPANGKFDLVVVDRTQVPATSAPPSGHYLFVGCVDPFGWLVKTGVVATDAPSSWAPSHPLLHDILPEALRVTSAMRTQASATVNASTIVESGTTPLVMEIRTGGTAENRAVYLCFDPTSSPAGSSLAFPLLILNSIDYLVPENTSTRAYALTGDLPIVGKSGQGVTVTGPDGQPVPLVTSGTDLRISQLLQPGEYHIKGLEGASILPVNYASVRAMHPLPRIAQPVAVMGSSASWLSALPLGAVVVWMAIALCIAETLLVFTDRVRI